MTNVYWLTQNISDVPPENDWLTAREAADLQRLRFAHRRSDWRLGRWTAKCAVARSLKRACYLQLLSRIEIRAAASGAPEVFLPDQPGVIAISLSHSNGTGLCIVALADVHLGCDLELIEPHSDGFIADYFTLEEQTTIAGTSAERPFVVSLLWSAKESALKALHEGLRLDTRSVTVSFAAPSEHRNTNKEDRAADSLFASPLLIGLSDWRPLYVRSSNNEIFHGWWQRTGQLVQTLVASSPPAYPIRLPGIQPEMSSDAFIQPGAGRNLCPQSRATGHAHKEP